MCLRSLFISCSVVFVTAGFSLADRVPYPAELEHAAVEVDSLNSILEHALIIGNGDINALLWTENGRPALMLTKNDVWDARLDSKLDPPIPTLALIKKYCANPAGGGGAALLSTGWASRGVDSYHAHPYPCPRACAKLVLGSAANQRHWRCIRSLGTHSGLDAGDTGAVMSVAGKPGASNGYAMELPGIMTDDFKKLQLTISGTPNAKFYIDLIDDRNAVLFKSGWTKTPGSPEEFSWDLPPGHKINRILLYSWTDDSKRAENLYHKVALVGAGKITIDLSVNAIDAPDFTGRIDVRRAMASVAGPINAEIRALADRNVFLIRTKAAARIEPLTSADTPEAQSGVNGGVQWLTQVMPGDEGWSGMSYAVAVATAGEWQAVAIVTSRESDDPRAAAIKLAGATIAVEKNKVIVKHEASWTEFWSASGIKLDDLFLTDIWYRNLYYLRCVTKPGVMPPGLFAGLVNSSPAWHGDYHTNYNIQQTFWSAFNTNHSDLAEPYARLMSGYLPRARWLCRQIFGFDGAYFPHVIFAYEPDPESVKSPIGRQYIHHVWGYTMGVPAFTVQPVWWHYKYQPDRGFLEETAYPLVRDVALFQVNFMDGCDVDESGKLVLGPTVSPEHWGWTKNFVRNRNCTFDIAMFRYLFNAAIEGAEILEQDSALVKRWQGALKRLPAYPTTAGEAPVVVDIQNAPPITYNITVPAVPVFPGDVVTWFSDDAEKAVFARTVERTRWNGNNAIYMMGVSRARLGMPGTREWLSDEIKARMRPNQTITLNRLGAGNNNHGHYTEQFAASMAIGELLLQSVGDVIRVFPAWTRDDGNAAFTSLRAQGGFLVSAEQKSGVVVKLEIISTAGGKLQLLSPWKSIKANGRALAPDVRGVVTLLTKPMERYQFKGE